MSVRAAAYCSSGMVTGSLATCHLWSRTFDSSRGLSLHLRKGDTEHQEFYHSQGARTIKENTAKRRWDKEELYLITKMELELITKGEKNIPKRLHHAFPHRSYEAFRSLSSENEEYKNCIAPLKAGALGNESTKEREDNSIKSQHGITLFWENNSADELELVRNWNLLQPFDQKRDWETD